MKVNIYSKKFNNAAGYDLRVGDQTATVQDYLDAVNAFIDDEKLVRGENLSVCKGCDGCCRERIPLTYIDVLHMQQSAAIQAASTGGQLSLAGLLAKFAYVYVQGPIVDISFGCRINGACIWLDEGTGCCQNYAWRPLVCQSFICIPNSGKAKALRSVIINQGMDELVRQAILAAGATGSPLIMHEADEPAICLADWPENPFSGKTAYSQVLLRDLCPVDLWQALDC